MSFSMNTFLIFSLVIGPLNNLFLISVLLNPYSSDGQIACGPVSFSFSLLGKFYKNNDLLLPHVVFFFNILWQIYN